MKTTFTILIATLMFAGGIKAQNLPKVDNKRIEYSTEQLREKEISEVKYHVWPKVKGHTDVLGFFNAIADAYSHIDLFAISQANINNEEDLGDAVAHRKTLDMKNGYIFTDFTHADMGEMQEMMVECCYWNKKNGTKLVAFNYVYHNNVDGQYFGSAHTDGILFYEYQPATRLLMPIAPPIEGKADLTGVRLPQVGRDLTLGDGTKLKWHDGYFTTADAVAPAKPFGTAPVPELGPTSVFSEYDFSPEAQKNFDDDTREDIFDIVGQGCSFYCGCNIGTQVASSTLAPQGKYNYAASNIHDLNYSTAWVEGVKGYGIGEWVEYTLPADNPRITEIGIANGLIRTKKAWTENSRVKVLEVSVNGKPHAMLYLKDVYAEQWFGVPTIGYDDRDDSEKLSNMPPIKIRFTIRDVYKGTKYDDTAITEIYFDGIDVH